MLTQNDIDEVASPPARPVKVSTDIVQWAVRNAYEEGYRAGNRSDERSKLNARYGKWFDWWMNSGARAALVHNGIISGDEVWR